MNNPGSPGAVLFAVFVFSYWLGRYWTSQFIIDHNLFLQLFTTNAAIFIIDLFRWQNHPETGGSIFIFFPLLDIICFRVLLYFFYPAYPDMEEDIIVVIRGRGA